MSDNEFTIKDSGERREFNTGSVRDIRSGKGRFDLISPIALKRLAQHYEAGCQKYGERNWEKGQPLTSYFDSAMRHMNEYMQGKHSEDHLAAAAWNIFALIHTETLIACGDLKIDLDDMPAHRPEATPQFSSHRIVKVIAEGTKQAGASEIDRDNLARFFKYMSEPKPKSEFPPELTPETAPKLETLKAKLDLALHTDTPVIFQNRVYIVGNRRHTTEGMVKFTLMEIDNRLKQMEVTVPDE